ncbi:MAG: aldehyde dehydrogenase family protein [Acidobacteria bacterium]|nr:aldehyde dehydrogenase family protein [Acidobacteriota bacterium]
MEIATHRYPVPSQPEPQPEPQLQPQPASGPAAAAAGGTPAHGEGGGAMPPTPRQEMDRAVDELQARKAAWTAVTVAERRALLDRLRRDFLAVSERWAAASAAAFGLPDTGETSLTGPYFVLRNLRLLDKSLAGIAAGGAPRIPGPVRQRRGGQVVAQVFPQDVYDRLFYGGVTAEVWMQPDVTPAGLAGTQAVAYRQAGRTGQIAPTRQAGEATQTGQTGPIPAEAAGGVALVLGAGNVSSIGPMDALYKLFVENRVVLYKAHPVNAYLGPLLLEAFRALAEDGFFRLVYGGALEGAYLCSHPGVDEIHITGSDKTYEAIVFGPGEEGGRRKARNAPLLAKPISAELGNVSPVIVVPVPGPAGGLGSYRPADLAYQAENLATMLTNNAGFNCNATRVVIQHAGSPDRERLLAALRAQLARLPPRRAYYPGAADRYHAFVAAHPEAERFGEESGDRLPWTLIPKLDASARGDICYTTEAFCGLFAETAIAAASIPEYLERAVAFANDSLWGTLNVTLLVPPEAAADPLVGAAVERAVAELRYGTVSINHWAAIGYGLVVTPWGAYPGHTAQDIQSGTGVVHNTLMFSRVQKSVVRAPFHAHPKPAWFATHRTAGRLTPKLVRFEAAPSPAKLPGIFSLALRG